MLSQLSTSTKQTPISFFYVNKQTTYSNYIFIHNVLYIEERQRKALYEMKSRLRSWGMHYQYHRCKQLDVKYFTNKNDEHIFAG